MLRLVSPHKQQQRKFLADLNVSLPLGPCQIMCLFNVLHREMRAVKMLGFILGIYYENTNMRCLFMSQN